MNLMIYFEWRQCTKTGNITNSLQVSYVKLMSHLLFKLFIKFKHKIILCGLWYPW